MIGMATGLRGQRLRAVRGSFAAFLSRAHDQIRMAGPGLANLKVCGSHVGVSIGEDGGSQMGLEDIAMFRSIPGGDGALSGRRGLGRGVRRGGGPGKGIFYIRTTRPAAHSLSGR